MVRNKEPKDSISNFMHTKIFSNRSQLLIFLQYFKFIQSTYDWINVYDGRSVYSAQIGDKLCGSSLPTTIVSSGNDLFIRFRSDIIRNKPVFQLQVEERGNFIKK